MKTNLADQITIKELDTREEMLTGYELIHQMYQDMDYEEFSQLLNQMIEFDNYKIIAAFLDDEMVGVSGYWVAVMLYCGKYLQVSNLVVNEKHRGFGIGKKIMKALEEKAKDLNCKKIALDSYTENKKSHSIYFRENYHIRGFHFLKDL